MESKNDGQYNNAPPQRVQNSVLISGFSWAEAATQKNQSTASRTSHISELMNPTQVTQSQSTKTKMNELKTQVKVKEIAGQLKRFKDLVIVLTNRLP
jgi:hypothetical protein